MAIDNLNDGVGKKIVEALKMQTSGQSSSEDYISEDPAAVEADNVSDAAESVAETDQSSDFGNDFTDDFENSGSYTNYPYNEAPSYQEVTPPNLQNSVHVPSERQMQIKSQLQFQAATQGAAPRSVIDNAFNQSLSQNLGAGYVQAQDDFEYPGNVAVLRQLIAKLPAGVSKQTGAIIIKQTMEALGISMGSVLQEAKQVQEALANNSKECQSSIVEYRKQIGILETKAQNYQRQASIMNDIISLFIQTR